MPPPPQPPHVTTELLLDSAPALQRKKGIKPFPHTFITRGDRCKPINRGEATWAKYYAALRQLAGDPNCPPSWWPHLHTHEEELGIMAISWDWPTCRRWSEKVFQMVVDGRLKEGWQGWAAIKDLQRDICRDAPRPQNRHYTNNYEQYRQNNTSSTNTTLTNQVHTAFNSQEDYNKDTMVGRAPRGTGEKTVVSRVLMESCLNALFMCALGALIDIRGRFHTENKIVLRRGHF